MPKYIYQIATASNEYDARSYKVQEANSLRKAIELASAEAEANSDVLDEKVFRNSFRKPSMIKVGFNCTKPSPEGERIDSAYAIYRYAYESGVPSERPCWP